ncbi:MAG: GNAT family N-acetyltransferase [Pasteurellaceae bacterium]|nr:GNAT family N-acetyltransferase [Pasteurellaceae bacterium]
MQRITLIAPNQAHFAELLAYKGVFLAQNLQIHGSCGLDRFADHELERWLEYVNSPAGTNWFGYDTVEDSTYLAWHLEQNRMVGIINIRHELTDFLRQFGGHIGYSIHPDFWNQGYGSEMLALALKESDKLGLNKVLITCDKTNPASAKVIINNGGVLENEVQNGENVVQRYWISR